MVCPEVRSRVKEPGNLARAWVYGSNVTSLVPVADYAAYVRLSEAEEPPCFRLMMWSTWWGESGVILVDQAIFATLAGTPSHVRP
jgi:hypothetical protein